MKRGDIVRVVGSNKVGIISEVDDYYGPFGEGDDTVWVEMAPGEFFEFHIHDLELVEAA